MMAPPGFGRPMARRDRCCAVMRVQSMARWSCRTSACSRGVDDGTARLWQADGTPGPVLRGHEGFVNGALELQDQRLLTWSDEPPPGCGRPMARRDRCCAVMRESSLARWSCRTSACSPGVLMAPPGFGRPMARRDRSCAVMRVRQWRAGAAGPASAHLGF